MKSKHTKDKRNALVEKQVRHIWTSLESHLEWTHKKSEDGRIWHIQCVKDYVEQLADLVKLF